MNYDVGNSSSPGYDFSEEMEFTGPDILNIHVKDRLFNGETCPLGKGAAGLEDKRLLVGKFSKLNMIIQGARSKNGDDIGLLAYLNFVKKRLGNEFDQSKSTKITRAMTEGAHVARLSDGGSAMHLPHLLF